MKLKTLGLVLVATAFMGTTAFAMDPVPNPPAKATAMHHKKHHHMKKDADATADKAEAKEAKESPKTEAKEAKAAAAKPAMPTKK